MKKLLSIFVFSLLTFSAAFSQEKSSSDVWNGLKFDVSTSADAIRLLGAAEKSKDKQNLEIIRAESWLSGKQNEKVFRSLIFKQIGENKNVQLSFLDDCLVFVSFDTPDAYKSSEWLDPDNLETEFGLSFKPYARKIGQTRPFYTDFPSVAPSELKKGDYKTFYDMMAVGEKVFVFAVVNNVENLVGGAVKADDPTDLGEKDRRAAINSAGKYPGFVARVQIISRRLAR